MRNTIILCLLLAVLSDTACAAAEDATDAENPSRSDTTIRITIDMTEPDDDAIPDEDASEDEVEVKIMEVLPPAPLVPVRYGDSGDGVLVLQERLRTLGFTLERADGVYGKRTTAYVRAMQTFLRGAMGASEATRVTGAVSQALADLINGGAYPRYVKTVARGDKGDQVMRVQRKLYILGYLNRAGVDSQFGEATEEALTRFQKAMALPGTGVADEDTQEALFSEAAVASETPYIAYAIAVSLAEQKVRVYGWSNDAQAYTEPVREMSCATGISGYGTPRGTFAIGEKMGEWEYFRLYDAYARYVTQFKGRYYFHSVLFAHEGDAEPIKPESEQLGIRATHGSIRLSVEDARWIYENCRAGTSVTIQ